MNATVRIESTRKNLIVLPPAYNAPEGKTEAERIRSKRMAHEQKAIEAAKWDPSTNYFEPTVTFIKRDYWAAIKDNPDVKRLFTRQEGVDGVLRVIEDDEAGPSKDATRPAQLPRNDGEAMVIVENCNDLDLLMAWAGQSGDRELVIGAISGRIAVVESEAKRGKGKTK